LVATGAGADLKDDVLLIMRIFGDKQNFYLFLHAREPRLQSSKLGLGVSAHLRVAFFGDHGLALGDALLERLVLAVLFDDFSDLAMRFGSLLVSAGVGDDLRRCQGLVQLFVF